MIVSIDCRFIGKSGIGTYIEGVVDKFICNYPQNHYLLIVEKELDKYVNIKNVTQFCTDIQPFTLKELFRFPVKEINKTDAFLSPYINIPFGIKIPVYTTIHDVIFWDIPELVSKVGLWMRSFFVKHAISTSKAIFTVSKFSQNRIVHHFNTQKPIIVVPNGIAEHIRNSKEEVSKEDYVLFVGNVKQHKGLSVLVDAFQKAKAKGLTAILKIVGNKDNFRTNDNSFLVSALEDKDIVFTGCLSNEDLVRSIASAKVLVLPSFYEGFGIPPMEALYLGTDAIVSDIEVLKEVYSNLPVTFFKQGDSYDLSEKLLSFKKNDFEGLNIRRLIENQYSYDITAKHIMETIKANW